jgi:sec-independent protein translocase protein TatA
MGPIGVQEMVIIFLVALVLFGPKKLPELGKTIAKAMTEFRRAQSDLKATFEREMASIERENESLKEVTRQTAVELSSYSDIDLSGGQSGTHADSSASSAQVSGSTSYGASEFIAGHPLPETLAAPHESVATSVDAHSSTVSASAESGAELPGYTASGHTGAQSDMDLPSWNDALPERSTPVAVPVIRPVAAQGVVARGSSLGTETLDHTPAIPQTIAAFEDNPLPSFGAHKGADPEDLELPRIG